MGKWITRNGVHVYLENEEPSLADAISEHYGKTKSPTIYLEKKEYAHVMSEINTWYKKEYKSSSILHKAIGDYIYIFENKGYNDYRIIGKIKIDEDD